MKWNIPAKTFLLGEYAAVAEASAIIMTTTPYFELSLINDEGLTDIHSDSPAGLLWLEKQYDKGLAWHDPYGCGGLGASSAQFLGAYLASCSIDNKIPNMNDMMQTYYECAWSGIGLRPSGYDIIAQSQHGCVFINKQQNRVYSYPWVFKDLSFFLLHTGSKLATHHHLQDATLPPQLDILSSIVDEANEAFDHTNSSQLIHTINHYHQQLIALNLVAEHSLNLIEQLKNNPEIVAIKGCGALGADVLLVLAEANHKSALKNKLLSQDWVILATEENITTSSQSLLIKESL